MRTASVPFLYCREVRCGGNCSSRLSWSSVWHGPRGTRLRRRCLLFGGARNGLTVQRAVLRPHGLSGHVSDQIEISPLPCLPLLAHSTTSPPPPCSTYIQHLTNTLLYKHVRKFRLLFLFTCIILSNRQIIFYAINVLYMFNFNLLDFDMAIQGYLCKT